MLARWFISLSLGPEIVGDLAILGLLLQTLVTERDEGIGALNPIPVLLREAIKFDSFDYQITAIKK